MMTSTQLDNERILRLVGAIVLVSQDIEHYLKITLPFLASDDPSLGAAIKRHEKLRKQTLGGLAGRLMDSEISDSLDLAQYMACLVDARNQVVHHFNETYGAWLCAGSHQKIFDSLETLLGNLKCFRSAVEQIALATLEGLRDVSFRDTPEYEQMASLCDSFRMRIAS